MNYKECIVLLKENNKKFKSLLKLKKMLYKNNTESKGYEELNCELDSIVSERNELKNLKEILEPPIILLNPSFNGYKQTN